MLDRSHAAAHVNTPGDILESLAHDEEPYVAQEAKNNITRRLEGLGVTKANYGARGMLRAGEWWNMKASDSEVTWALSRHPNP